MSNSFSVITLNSHIRSAQYSLAAFHFAWFLAYSNASRMYPLVCLFGFLGLVVCLSGLTSIKYLFIFPVFSWGFRGLNYHWGEMRQYTFPEVIGGLYQVDEMELRDLRTLPFVKILLNS